MMKQDVMVSADVYGFVAATSVGRISAASAKNIHLNLREH